MKNRFLDMSDTDYRAANGLANSDALMVQNDPGLYQWSKNAERDALNVDASNFGTTVHSILLEPEKFKSQIVQSEFKSTTTKGYAKEVEENKGKIVLLEDDIRKIKVLEQNVHAHPLANFLLNAEGNNESSIFVECSETGVLLKCRPDRDCVESIGYGVDVKTTDDLDAWRDTRKWINPLFKFDYGHQAAFYLNVLSEFYGKQVDNFAFIAIQKKVEFGRYKVGVFEVNRDELVEWGFWDRMLNNIKKYKDCVDNNQWMHSERFAFNFN